MKYYPFGETRSGSTPTDRRYTGQREETGLGSLYDYGARLYSPVLGRFISADSIVPGAASGSGGGAGTLGVDSGSRLTALTTDFHEFIGQVTKENQAVLQYGPFFQWSEKVRQDNPVPSGPLNPQALNRYAYCLNNPLRYVDPTGHEEFVLSKKQIDDLWNALNEAYINESKAIAVGTLIGVTGGGVMYGSAHAGFVPPVAAVGEGVGAAMVAIGGLIAAGGAWYQGEIQDIMSVLSEASGKAAAGSGFATITMEHTALGLSAKISCISCSNDATILDYAMPGRRSILAEIMWGQFRSAHNTTMTNYLNGLLERGGQIFKDILF